MVKADKNRDCSGPPVFSLDFKIHFLKTKKGMMTRQKIFLLELTKALKFCEKFP